MISNTLDPRRKSISLFLSYWPQIAIQGHSLLPRLLMPVACLSILVNSCNGEIPKLLAIRRMVSSPLPDRPIILSQRRSSNSQRIKLLTRKCHVWPQSLIKYGFAAALCTQWTRNQGWGVDPPEWFFVTSASNVYQDRGSAPLPSRQVPGFRKESQQLIFSASMDADFFAPKAFWTIGKCQLPLATRLPSHANPRQLFSAQSRLLPEVFTSTMIHSDWWFVYLP